LLFLQAGATFSELIAVQSLRDASLVQKSILFAMDNSIGQDKKDLGGEIDIAIIRRDRTIEWIARKSSCSQQDLKPVSRK
jgi:hypothetical protein